jgi:tetratricopeptide (TPR) repeat protein
MAARLDPTSATAFLNVGVALTRAGRMAEAVEQYRTSVRLQPSNAQAHSNLGHALSAQGDLAGAEAAHRAALHLKPDAAANHFNVGYILGWREDYKGAEACYRKALEFDPSFAEAHLNLGFALQNQGKLADGVAPLRHGHELGVKRSGWRYPSEGWVKEAERLAELENRLPRFVSGEIRPSGAEEQAELARVCVCKKQSAAAVRFWAAAFTVRPELADDLPRGRRFAAACAAARVGDGGEDADKLNAAERTRWRGQALVWLRADLESRARQIVFGSSQERSEAREALLNWGRAAALAGVRDPQALPEPERAEWRRLWQDAAVVLQRTYEIK